MKKIPLLLLLVLVCAAGHTVSATETYVPSGTWGTSGYGDGQFTNPTGVALDGAGNIYVVEENAIMPRVQKFNSTGAFVAKWGTGGDGDGQFYNPFGIAVDGAGNVYVADTFNDRIQKFNSSGAFLTKWGSYGAGDGQFSSPYGVAVDAGGVYVTDHNNDRVQKFDSNGTFLATWGSEGTGDGQFEYPYGVAVDGSGNVYVAEPDRVQKFDSNGTFLMKWGSEGTGDGQFWGARGIAVDGAGSVFVVEGPISRVQKFTPDGTFITNWGSIGSADGQLNTPFGIAVDGAGTVYVADAWNNRIQMFARLWGVDGTNLYLSKNAPASMDRGEAVTYTLYYTNFGTVPASSVLLEDTLPPEVDFLAASDGGTYNATTRNVTWEIGVVAARGSRNVTVKIPDSVPEGTEIVNHASISTATPETMYDDNGASASTRVRASNLPTGVEVGPVVDTTGGTPSVYWGSDLRFTYTTSDPTVNGVDIGIHIDDGGPDITGSMTVQPGGGDEQVWGYTWNPHKSRRGVMRIRYTIHHLDGRTPVLEYPAYLDPAGYIYDADTQARIPGATVWLQRPDGQGGWENVPTGLTPAISQPDTNPLTTNAGGQFQWDVLSGAYRVHVEAPGYLPAESIVVSIPPPVTDLHVGLTRDPSATPVLVPGGAGVPTDTNGDGLYEDVNGNDRPDFADVVLYFNQMSWIAANEPIAAFDYNGNGRIDFSDVVWLFNHL